MMVLLKIWHFLSVKYITFGTFSWQPDALVEFISEWKNASLSIPTGKIMTAVIWLRMLVSQKRRWKKNPHSRNDMAEKTVTSIKMSQDQEWDGAKHSTPGKNIGWQNSTVKTDVVRVRFKDGKWMAGSKADTLLCNREDEPGETTKEMDREHKRIYGHTKNKYNLRKQVCLTVKWRRLVAASSSFS